MLRVVTAVVSRTAVISITRWAPSSLWPPSHRTLPQPCKGLYLYPYFADGLGRGPERWTSCPRAPSWPVARPGWKWSLEPASFPLHHHRGEHVKRKVWFLNIKRRDDSKNQHPLSVCCTPGPVWNVFVREASHGSQEVFVLALLSLFSKGGNRSTDGLSHVPWVTSREGKDPPHSSVGRVPRHVPSPPCGRQISLRHTVTWKSRRRV